MPVLALNDGGRLAVLRMIAEVDDPIPVIVMNRSWPRKFTPFVPTSFRQAREKLFIDRPLRGLSVFVEFFADE